MYAELHTIMAAKKKGLVKPGKLEALSLRITSSLKRRIQKAAEKSGRSVSAEVEALLEAALAREGRLVLAKDDRWAPVASYRQLGKKGTGIAVLLGSEHTVWLDLDLRGAADLDTWFHLRREDL